MRTTFVSIVFASLVGLTAVFWYATLRKTPAPIAEQVAAVPAPVPPTVAAPFAPVVVAEPVAEVPRPKRVDPEVERMKAIVRAIDERYLESSPAKDTPEAEQIEAMLAKRGIDRVEMPLAYNITWNYNHFLKVTGQPEIARMQVGDFMSRLSKKGPIDEAFWTELFAIKPTVFYGQKDLNMPKEFAQQPH